MLVLMTIGMFVHVCVLPLHAEAAGKHPIMPAESHGHGPTHDSDDAIHPASCEALPSSGVPATPALAVASGAPVVEDVPVVQIAMPLERRAWPRASPSPLFLLHASLLI